MVRIREYIHQTQIICIICRTHLILNGLFSRFLFERDDVAETVPHYSCGAVERQDGAG